jgi:hypothetical protein
VAIDPAEHEFITREKDANVEVVERQPFKLSTFISNIDEGLKQNQGFLDNPISDLILPKHEKSEAQQKNLKGSRGFNTVRDVYDFAVSQTDLHTVSSLPDSELLALALLRQWPSPARIYRVWRTTQHFWQAVASNFQSQDCIGPVDKRLHLRLRPDRRTEGLSLYHTYDLKLRDINLSVTKVADREFVTVDNLQRTAFLLNAPQEHRKNYSEAVNYIDEQLQEQRRMGKPIKVEEPTGYGSPNRELGELYIESVTREETPYIPSITILTQPRTFMAIVPADKALNVANAIKKRYL